ncbi:hypothetical protein P3L10_027639 [Capsicum annuum]
MTTTITVAGFSLSTTKPTLFAGVRTSGTFYLLYLPHSSVCSKFNHFHLFPRVPTDILTSLITRRVFEGMPNLKKLGIRESEEECLTAEQMSGKLKKLFLLEHLEAFKGFFIKPWILKQCDLNLRASVRLIFGAPPRQAKG